MNVKVIIRKLTLCFVVAVVFCCCCCCFYFCFVLEKTLKLGYIYYAIAANSTGNVEYMCVIVFSRKNFVFLQIGYKTLSYELQEQTVEFGIEALLGIIVLLLTPNQYTARFIIVKNQMVV